MEGFDLQLTGGGWSVSELLADVRSWFDVARRPLPSGVVLALDSAQQRLTRNGGTQTAVPLDILLTHAPPMLAHFDTHAAALREAHGPLRASRYQRVLQNLVEYRSMLQDRDRSRAGGPGSTEIFLRSYYQRERSNAANLLWLINERYRNEKVIVWLHNVHAVNARISLGYDSLLTTERPVTYESTGRHGGFQ